MHSRIKLLRVGLHDPDAPVRTAAAKMVARWYTTHCGGSLVELMTLLAPELHEGGLPAVAVTHHNAHPQRRAVRTGPGSMPPTHLAPLTTPLAAL